MNANELADKLKLFWHTENDNLFEEAATMLRQQHADLKDADKYALELERLYEDAKAEIEQWGVEFDKLTDEEINKLWAESHEDGIAIQQGFATQQHYFAHLILRKAQE